MRPKADSQTQARERSTKSMVVIFGPRFGPAAAGGLQTHMNFLSELKCFEDATFVSLGSASGLIGRIKTVLQLFDWRKYAAAQNARHVLINSSLYFPSLLKLGFLLAALRLLTVRAQSLVIFFHGGRLELSKRPVARKLVLMLMPVTASYYFLTEEQREQFAYTTKRVDSRQLRLFQNFSSASSASPLVVPPALSSKTFEIVCVGRVVAEKGQKVACEAVRSFVARDEIRVRLTIVGVGPDLARLEQEYAKEIERGTINLAGFRSGEELKRLYGQSHLLLLPTTWPEGLPYVLIEAYQAGVPVAATPVGALGRHVRAIDPELLLRAASVDEVLRVVAMLANDPERLASCRAAAAYHFDTHFSRTFAEEFYSELLLGGTENNRSGRQI